MGHRQSTTPTASPMKIGALLFPLLPLCRSGILRELKATVVSWERSREMRSPQNYDEEWITVTPLHHWDHNALVGQTRRIEAVVGEPNVVRRSDRSVPSSPASSQGALMVSDAARQILVARGTSWIASHRKQLGPQPAPELGAHFKVIHDDIPLDTKEDCNRMELEIERRCVWL